MKRALLEPFLGAEPLGDFIARGGTVVIDSAQEDLFGSECLVFHIDSRCKDADGVRGHLQLVCTPRIGEQFALLSQSAQNKIQALCRTMQLSFQETSCLLQHILGKEASVDERVCVWILTGGIAASVKARPPIDWNDEKALVSWSYKQRAFFRVEEWTLLQDIGLGARKSSKTQAWEHLVQSRCLHSVFHVKNGTILYSVSCPHIAASAFLSQLCPNMSALQVYGRKTALANLLQTRLDQRKPICGLVGTGGSVLRYAFPNQTVEIVLHQEKDVAFFDCNHENQTYEEAREFVRRCATAKQVWRNCVSEHSAVLLFAVQNACMDVCSKTNWYCKAQTELATLYATNQGLRKRLCRLNFANCSLQELESGLEPVLCENNNVFRASLVADYARCSRAYISMVTGLKSSGKTQLVQNTLQPWTDNEPSSLGLYVDLLKGTAHRFCTEPK